MVEKIKKSQRTFLIGLIVICTLIMALGIAFYLEKIENRLKDDLRQDVMNITMQQKQALEIFISGEQERLHSYAGYFAESDSVTKESVQERLKMFEDVDSVYSVICLDEGWACSNVYQDIRQLDEEQLEGYPCE